MRCKQKYWFLILVVLIPMLTSCASGPAFIPVSAFNHEHKALIYIYRESKMLGGAVEHYLNIDGKQRVKITNGGYSVLEVAPGEQTIYLSSKANVLTWLTVVIEKAIFKDKEWEAFSFDAKVGQTYYLKFRLNTKSEEYPDIGHSMVMVDSAVGRAEIENCSKVELLKSEKS